MFCLADKEKIGAYLKNLLDQQEYNTTADFCRDYLKLKNNSDDFSDTELQNERNRFSQIFKGEKNIRIYDLPILSELLKVSCEEILSARKQYVPSPTHITNYDIAKSEDRNVWDEYMKREDRLFLNCDEYCKSVIDYALEFKNYKFLKYLLEERFIWFVNDSKPKYELFFYGADTSIKSKWERFQLPDQFTSHELYEKDILRTQTIALAIQNNDFDILDSMLSREIPEMHEVNAFGNREIDFSKNKNYDLIDAISRSESDSIIEYFSDEFTIQDIMRRENTYVFPFLKDVIIQMIEYKKEQHAKVILKKAIVHNKKIFEKINNLIKESCNYYSEHMIVKRTEDEILREVLCCFKYDSINDCVTFFFDSQPYIGIATNVVYIKEPKGTSTVKDLIKELNQWYNKILSLGGEKYAKILL